MKKIICGLVIALCLCASVFAEPTKEELAARGIEISTGENGQSYYVYSVMNKPVKGKSYMCLSWHRTTEKQPDNDGYYNVFLHEVIKSTDENSVEVNGTYVRFYPSLTVRINIDAVTLGDIIVFDSVDTLFGKEWVTVQGPWNNWSYATRDPVLDIDVNHKYINHFAMVEKELLEQKGIELKTNNNGSVTAVYAEENDLKNGERYMCLNFEKKKEFGKNEDGYYIVPMYRVVDKTHPHAEKVGSKYVESYPTALVWVKDNKKLKIPNEVKFDTLQTVFGKANWKVQGPWPNWGWSTFDDDLKIFVAHKCKNYQVDVE